ncbi:hypothetical protein SK3146_02936 [Paenibacillus konkukensis]|uniref:Sporulation protein YjcZ n=1 Tax=Paenibacillus konkukensis TaxID=2020716 RepID=A0ABY4RQR1_9BACL|nr:hypothetical protein [Paenibacillus konkukensis]UQZ83729.1 hypothetical protein SK3146_02936 [Paenibacillus konkukensis]
MDKFKPMPMPMPSMPMTSPAMQMPMPPMNYPMQAAPINLHATYEEINIYEPKKHHHGHCCQTGGGWATPVGTILVLYILLVIILRGTCK